MHLETPESTEALADQAESELVCYLECRSAVGEYSGTGTRETFGLNR